MFRNHGKVNGSTVYVQHERKMHGVFNIFNIPFYNAVCDFIGQFCKVFIILFLS